MKKFLVLFLMIVVFVGFIFANGEKESSNISVQKEAIEISLAHGNAIDQPIGTYSQLFANKVNEESNGRIHVTVYPAGQLGNAIDLMANVSNGLQDMSIIDIGYLNEYKPEYAMVSLPMMVNSWEQAEKVLDSDECAEMNEEIAKDSNIRIMGWWWNGFRNMCCKEEINEIADFKGKKFRSPGLDMYLKMFELLDAKPTIIAWGDTYSGLQSGLVDGMETTTEALVTQSFYKIADNIILTRHIFSCNAPIINEQLWKSLSTEDQELLITCMNEVTEELRVEVIDKENGYLDTLKTSGNNVVVLKDQDKLVDLFTPYWNEYAEKYDCADFMNFIISCK